MAYDIQQYWASPATYTPGNNGRRWIVVHYTATSASAYNNCVYFSGGNRNASAHYFIDDSSIWQSVPEDASAWHAGNWNINSSSIGIEVVSDGTDFTPGEIDRLAWLVGVLMDRYDIDAGHVIRHYDVADVGAGSTLDPHKRCPAPYVDAGKWQALHARITAGNDGKDDIEVVTDEDINRIALAVWAFKHNDVQMRDKVHGIDIAANGANNKLAGNELADKTALATWAFKQNGVQMRDRVYGIDLAANSANIIAKNYLPAIMSAVQDVASRNGIDVSAIADEVQAAVKSALEKISLDVTVND